MNYAEESLKKHYEWKGKIEVAQRVEVKDKVTFRWHIPPVLSASKWSLR